MNRILMVTAAILVGTTGSARLAAAPLAKCKVSGSVTSTDYQRMGGTLERSIVYVLEPNTKQRVAESYSKENLFEFDLMPGNYLLQCTGNGSRGATFEPTQKAFIVREGTTALDLGLIDMPVSATTKLFGRPAPELSDVAAWKNTQPLALSDLHGKVVVLDFWGYYCSICIHHMPDLARLAQKHHDGRLVILTVHDSSLHSIEEVEKHLSDQSKQKLGELPIALDGRGSNGVFRAYGIHAVPAVILIDAKGQVVRRFHHAGDPALERTIDELLRTAK